jgi:hypothetical protein
MELGEAPLTLLLLVRPPEDDDPGSAVVCMVFDGEPLILLLLALPAPYLLPARFFELGLLVFAIFPTPL